MSQEWGERRAEAYPRRIRELFPRYDALQHAAADLLAGARPPPARVLCAGAGVGDEAFLLAAMGYQTLALDPSAAMIEAARERATGENPRFAVGGVDSLPPEPEFDAVTLLLVLHFLPDDGAKAALLRELARRCAPNGVLVLVDLVGEPGAPRFERAMAAWRAEVAERSTPGGLARDFAAIEADVHFASDARTAELLSEAGWQPEPVAFRDGLLAGRLARRRAG